jgi:pimeloyl-ACP methyl ester carboxylesterase
MDSQGHGWNIAKKIAQQNGPKLANFLVNYLTVCNLQNHQNTDIRIIGHSLGARVILSALAYLNSNQTWNSENLKIKSVHLLGAAVDQDSPSVNSLYGRAIANTTKKFYNLYDGLDDILYSFYYLYDNEKYPLGLYPASDVVPIPQNLREKDVASPGMYYRDADSDGRETCFEDLMNWPSVLQNHCAYMGVRDPIHRNLLIDDGAMQFVADDWRGQP